MFKNLALLFFQLIFFIGSSWANQLDHRFQKAFKVQKLSIEQGLSQSVVYDTIQDSNGYIWIATEDGLNRFDGYEFEIFEHQHSNPESLHENLIYTLLEEPGAGLWIGTQNGLSFFDFYNRSFKSFGIAKQVKLAGVSDLLIVNDKLFIAAENGLYTLDKSSESLDLFISHNGKSFESEIVSIERNETHIFFATGNCVYSIDIISQDIKNWCQLALSEILKDRRIKLIKIYRSHLWIGTDDGLIDLDLATNQNVLYRHIETNANSLSSNWVQDLEFDQKGNLWIGTTGGADYLDFSTGQFKHFQHQIYDNDGLSSNDVMSIFIDRSQLIWLGTYTGGVNILDQRQTSFKHILTQSDLAAFNASNTIHGITKDDEENLWVASYGGGLLKLDLMTGEIERPFHEKMLSIDPNSAYIYSLFFDYQKRLWIGTASGLLMIDLGKKEVIPLNIYIDQKLAKFSEYIFQIYQDSIGRLWIGTISGLYYLEKVQEENHQLFLYLQNKTQQLPSTYLTQSQWVTSILQAQDGNLWIGGQSGLAMYSALTDKWQHFISDRNDPSSLSYNDVQALYEDSRGILWIATANGLNKLNWESDNQISFERYTKENGLVNNAVYGVLENSENKLWLSTNLGLMQFSAREDQILSFKRNDGLSSNEFNKGAFFADEDELLYFGSINGITVVKDERLDESERKRQLKFTSIKKDHVAIDIESINRQETPLLTRYANERTLSFAVTDLYYRKLGTQRYRYRLIGLSDDWVELGKDRQFILDNLDEGDYQLEIQSKVENESWSNQSKILRLKVYTNFWKSEEGYYLIGLLISFLFAVMFYLTRFYYRKKIGLLGQSIRRGNIDLTQSKREIIDLKNKVEMSLEEDLVNKKKISELSVEIENYSLKDPLTGFFRFRNLVQLIQRSQIEQASLAFTSMILFEITNLNLIGRSYGELAAAEVTENISQQIKKLVSGGNQIAIIRTNLILIIGNIEESNNLISNLIRLKQKLMRSRLSVANGLTTDIQVALSYIDNYPDRLELKSMIESLTLMLVNLHTQNFPRLMRDVMRVDLNENVKNFKFDTSSLDFEVNSNDPKLHHWIDQLIDSNRITLHYLNTEK